MADFYDTGNKSWFHDMTNVSIPGEYVENSSTLAVYVPINLSIKLEFVSVNGPRETYFVAVLRVLKYPTCLKSSENRIRKQTKEN